MSTTEAPVKTFVHRLMNDELLLNQFRSDPESTLAKSDLEFNEEQRTALQSGDKSKIREYIGDAKTHFVAVIVVVKSS